MLKKTVFNALTKEWCGFRLKKEGKWIFQCKKYVELNGKAKNDEEANPLLPGATCVSFNHSLL